MMELRQLCVCAALGIAGAAGALVAHAQAYPTKPIRLVCPFPPGGTTDVVARMVAQGLSEAWGHQVIVDNRGGAGGLIGTETVAKASPDGYTVLLGSITTHAVNPALYKKINFDPVKDFAPVSLVVSSPQLLAVHPSVAAKSIKDLIALARAKPGQLNYASAGSGTSPHLTFELFKSVANIDVTHVPYKGTGPAITELVGGQVQTMITGVVALMPHIKSGKLRGLAVTSKKRVAALPEIPTMIESGVPGFDVSSWFGVFLPAGTPKVIVAKMNGEIHKILAKPDVRKRLMDLGADPDPNSPEEFVAYVKSEMVRWGNVVNATGARAD
jgi:tripartite-type tricarboxylate transporter receptor subunit TctC